MKAVIFFFFVLFTLGANAFEVDRGGVYCTQCPGETSKCAPRPDCCPSNSADNCRDSRVGTACGVGHNKSGSCRVSQEHYSCFCSSNFLDQ